MNFQNLEVDATPSWSGYNYQGKIAIYKVLQLINKLIKDKKSEDIAKYELELEWLEDFSILFEEQYESIHQVKALNTSSLANYDEALLGLAKKIYNEKSIKAAYLHTWKKVKVNDSEWNDEIRKVIKSAIIGAGLKQKLEELLTDENMLDQTIKRIKNPKSGSPPKEIIRIKVHLNDEDISKVNIKKAVQKELDFINNGTDSFINELMGPISTKINLHTYDSNKFCDLDQIEDYILVQIKQCLELKESWMANDEVSIKNIYLKIQKLIDDHIVKRHMSGTRSKLKFSEFEQVVDDSKIPLSTAEINLMKLKSKIFYLKDRYCFDRYCRTNDCEDCKVDLAMKNINSLKINNFERFVRLTSPEVKGLITDDRVTSSMFETNGTYGCFFKLLSGAKHSFIFENDAISYYSRNKELLYLTTLAENSKTIENCCRDIVENKEIDGIFMDIDYILSKDIETESIFKTASSILSIEPEEEVDLKNHILHCKRIGIIKEENFEGWVNK